MEQQWQQLAIASSSAGVVAAGAITDRLHWRGKLTTIKRWRQNVAKKGHLHTLSDRLMVLISDLGQQQQQEMESTFFGRGPRRRLKVVTESCAGQWPETGIYLCIDQITDVDDSRNSYFCTITSKNTRTQVWQITQVCFLDKQTSQRMQ